MKHKDLVLERRNMLHAGTLPGDAPSQLHVVITPQGELLRYPTIAKAKAMCMDTTIVYTCPAELAERLTYDSLVSLYKKCTRGQGKATLPKSKDRMADLLFPELVREARPSNPWLKRAGKTGVRADRASQTVHFCDKSLIPTLKMPPQAKVVAWHLSDRQPSTGWTWDGLEMTVRNLHDENILLTKQDPTHIWRYYVPTYERLGVFEVRDSQGEESERPKYFRRW